jgi:hypothetical protein
VSWLAVAAWHISFWVSELAGVTNTIVFMQTPLKGGCRTRKKQSSIPVASSMRVSILGQDRPSQNWRTRPEEGRGITMWEKMTQFPSRTDARGETLFSTATGQFVLDSGNDHRAWTIYQASSHREIKLYRGVCIARVVGGCSHGVRFERRPHSLMNPGHSITEFVSVAGVSIAVMPNTLVVLEFRSKNMA